MTWVIIAISLGSALAQAQHSFVTTPLPIWDALAADVNGDGFKDILVYSSDAQSEPARKELVIFLAGTSGRFENPDRIAIPLQPENGTAFTTEIDGKPPQEIVLADQGSARVLRLDGRDIREVGRVEFSSLLPTGSREPVFLRGASKDLDGDGRDEWLLPLAGAYGVFSGAELRARIPAPTSSELRDFANFQISHRLPDISTFKMPEEALQAIALLSDTHAEFSYGREWSLRERFTIPRRLDKKWDAAAELDDINADGWPDLMVTQTSGTINLKTETQIYFATGPFLYPAAPSFQVTQTGSFISAALRDTNGDKKLDLVFVSVPIGLGNIINYFLRQKVTVEAAVHEFRSVGFHARPDRESSLTVDAPEGRERGSYALGNFDGDALLDVAVGTTAKIMTFYRGASRDFFAAGAWTRVTMPTFGIARTGDLDANGKDDLLLIHPSGPNERRLDIVMF